MIARSGDLLVLGLTRENVRRMVDERQPVRVSRHTHGDAIPPDLTIGIVFGETLGDIAQQLKEAGFPTPDVTITRAKGARGPDAIS
jgi:hypothetical protein